MDSNSYKIILPAKLHYTTRRGKHEIRGLMMELTDAVDDDFLSHLIDRINRKLDDTNNINTVYAGQGKILVTDAEDICFAAAQRKLSDPTRPLDLYVSFEG